MSKHDKHKEEKKEIKIKDEKEEAKTGKEEILDKKNDKEVIMEEKTETEKLKQEMATLKDTLLRKVAEFENYKKRTEGEISNYIKYASENLIKQLIPVYDDFIRTSESIEKGETKDFETLKKGFNSIYKKFEKILKKEGLKEMDVLGKEFDVNLCDALLQMPKEDVAPHTVLEVVEKGYFLKDKVLRHAKVIVSAEATKNVEENRESEND